MNSQFETATAQTIVLIFFSTVVSHFTKS